MYPWPSLIESETVMMTFLIVKISHHFVSKVEKFEHTSVILHRALIAAAR